jgi:WD40 repeat protein
MEPGVDVFDVALSLDGKMLACRSAGPVRLWDLTGAEPRKKQDLPYWSGYAVCFTPDGKQLLFGDKFGRLLVWDFAAQEPVREWKLPGAVRQVVVPRDGRHVLVFNGNSTIYVLRLAPRPGSDPGR